MSNAGFIMTTSNSDEIIEILEEELNKRKSHPLCEQITLSMTKESILNIIKEYKSQKRCIGKLEKIGYYFDKTIQLLEKENEKQKEEIERLKAESDMADGYADALVERTKIKAIKEFAESLKEKANAFGDVAACVVNTLADNLVKEMEGGTDE